MGAIFGGAPKPPAPQPLPPPPQITDPEVEAARRRQLRADQVRRGRSATLLTGGEGVVEEPTVQKKRLLGE